MSRGRILYIGGFNLPDKNAAAQRVIANSKLCRDLDFEVKLVGLSKTDYQREFIYEGFECCNYKYPEKKLDWIHYLTQASLYTQVINDFRPDLIIAYNHPAIALMKLHSICKKNNIKLISDCTEWYQPIGNIVFKILKFIDSELRMRWVQRHLDGLIVISQFLNDFYVNNRTPVLLLPPLVDKSENKWKIAQERNHEDHIIRLLYAGSPGAGNKDRIDVIINAVNVVRSELNIDIQFTIAGITELQFQQIYVGNKEKITSNIHFLGRISHQEVLDVLAQSDFQIFLRENNRANTAGFPTKFVESISSRTLVLTNTTSDLSMYLKNEVNGFILDTSSKESLISSLKSALKTKKEVLEEMKSHMDSDMFDYRKYLTRTEKFFNNI